MTDLITRLCSSDDPDKLEAADTIEALQERVKVLEGIAEQVPRALNDAFAAGSEERENGSATRQGKYLVSVDKLRDTARAALKGGET